MGPIRASESKKHAAKIMWVWQAWAMCESMCKGVKGPMSCRYLLKVVAGKKVVDIEI